MKQYRQKFDTFIRQYDDVGYICSKKDFGDRVFDAVGAVFLTALSRKPQTLKELIDKIYPQFIDVDKETLTEDVVVFYTMLEEDGFIVSGNSETELDQKDRRFSYSDLNPKTINNDFTPILKRSEVNTQDFLEQHFKDKPHLMDFQIELTSRCNERCVHCYIPHSNKLDDIDDNLFYSVLEQCKEMGLLDITLSGGEAMLHPHFIDYLRKAKEYDFSVSVLSNLTLLNDEIVREMKENRLSSVQVSLYSMNPEVHDAITQKKGSFYKTRDAILKLIENDIPLQISCPTMKQNKNDFAEVLKWANSLRVRTITDYIMMARYDHTTDNLYNRLSLEEAGKIIRQDLENDEDMKSKIQRTDFDLLQSLDDSEDRVCGVCMTSLCMVANGGVYPCSGWQCRILGNLKTQTLKDIWENSEDVKYLRNIRKKDFLKCQKCEDKVFCSMCMVRNANENPEGDPFKINEHFCKVAALNKQIVLEWEKNHLKNT